jgi:hypothetical protein
MFLSEGKIMKNPGNPAGIIRTRTHFIVFAAFIVIIILACWAYVEFISDAPAIYTAGSYTSGRGFRKPCYFRYYRKGLNRYELSMPLFSQYGEADAITVAGETVYTAGFFMIENDRRPKACYWQGTELVELPAPPDTQSKTSAITVAEGTVYTVGRYFTDDLDDTTDDLEFTACYWRGTERIELPLPAEVLYVETTAITVEKETVYIAGYYLNANREVRACYWQGTQRIELPSHGDRDLRPMDIAVAEGTVYIAGGTNTNANAYYWQGTELTELPAPPHTYAWPTVINVKGGTVYTAGFCRNDEREYAACYWRGTEQKELPVPPAYGESSALAIAMSGRTVYAAGIYGDVSYGYSSINESSICYWKNGKFLNIGPVDGYATGFFIHFK